MKVKIEWVALVDRLPEKEKMVLLTKRFGNFKIGFLSPEGDWWGESVKNRNKILYSLGLSRGYK